jgi:ferritin-like protein
MSDIPALHEPASVLDSETLDNHRAYRSLMEELEAVDWYSQRIAGATDRELAAILAHNRDEEKEHSAMLLEWIRRRDATFDNMLRRYLFTDESIDELEKQPAIITTEFATNVDLGIGSLREHSPELNDE